MPKSRVKALSSRSQARSAPPKLPAWTASEEIEEKAKLLQHIGGMFDLDGLRLVYLFVVTRQLQNDLLRIGISEPKIDGHLGDTACTLIDTATNRLGFGSRSVSNTAPKPALRAE